MAQRTASKKPGRPPGKRTDPDYAQHSVWLPNDLYGDILRSLVTPKGKRYEFSELVGHLLRRWLEAGGRLPKE